MTTANSAICPLGKGGGLPNPKSEGRKKSNARNPNQRACDSSTSSDTIGNLFRSSDFDGHRLFEQPGFIHQARQFGDGLDVQFSGEICAVQLDRAQINIQRRGDFLVHFALNDVT